MLALLAIVALASSGRQPFTGGERPGHEPSTLFWDYLFSFAIAVWFVLAGLLFWAMVVARGQRRQRRPQRSKAGLALLAGLFLGLAVVARVAPERAQEADRSRAGGQITATAPTTTGSQLQPYTPEFRWMPVLLLGSLGVLTAAYFTARSRYRRRAGAETSDEALLEELTEMLDDALGDLRAERDPRRAVIAAYARMERVLAAFGLARRSFEAPLEYLDRIAAELHDRQPSARRFVFELTHLYERAKFSDREIDAEMKDDAIATLVRLRDELRNAGEPA